MTPEQLNQIQERCEKATPGPWTSTIHGSVCAQGTEIQPHVCVASVSSVGDLSFITHAIIDIPLLLADNEQLKKLLRRAKCPCCDGSGRYPQQISDDECEEVQCQWCFETKAILGEET